MNFIAKLLRGKAAATAIGYGVIAALAAVPEMTTVSGLGKQRNPACSKTSGHLDAASAYPCARSPIPRIANHPNQRLGAPEPVRSAFSLPVVLPR